jgi:hypothetical protein
LPKSSDHGHYLTLCSEAPDVKPSERRFCCAASKRESVVGRPCASTATQILGAVIEPT